MEELTFFHLMMAIFSLALLVLWAMTFYDIYYSTFKSVEVKYLCYALCLIFPVVFYYFYQQMKPHLVIEKRRKFLSLK